MGVGALVLSKVLDIFSAVCTIGLGGGILANAKGVRKYYMYISFLVVCIFYVHLGVLQYMN